MFLNQISFVNLPSTRFKRAQLNMQYLKWFFTARENAHGSKETKMVEALKCSDARQFEKLRGNSIVNFDSFYIGDAIQEFTNYNRNYEKVKDLLNKAKAKSDSYIKQYQIDETTIKINTNKGEINVAKLSTVAPQIYKLFPNIDKYHERQGNCHWWCIKLARNCQDYPIKVCTGFIAPFCNDQRYLHSWIEFKKDGKWYVLDTNRNAIFNKSGYYLTQNIDGAVYKISNKTIQKEKDIVDLAYRDYDVFTKLYLSNRHQAVKLYKQYLANNSQPPKTATQLLKAILPNDESLVAGKLKPKSFKMCPSQPEA